MPLDIGLWRLDDGIQRLLPTGMPSEKRLEDLIETDPSVLGTAALLDRPPGPDVPREVRRLARTRR